MLNDINIFCQNLTQIIFENSQLPLTNKETHLYYFDLRNAEISSNLFQYLNAVEKEKAQRFLKKTDAVNYIAGKVYTRAILKFYNKMEADIFIDTNGKPLIANNTDLPARYFNLSHSGTHLVIAMSQNDVGADIEVLRSIDLEELKTECFTANENNWLDACQSEVQGFYTLWTRKEAFLKAEGTGLSDDLKSFEVYSESNATPVKMKHRYNSYHISTFQITETVICSVCNTSGNFEIIRLFDGKQLFMNETGNL